MSSGTEERKWISDVEIENAQVKWNFSNFDGREGAFNSEGDHNFNLILDEQMANELREEGWAVRTMEGREEGDPPEYLLKVKISYKYEAPKIFLIKNNRKIRADEADLADIKRSTCEKLDVIITPSRWVSGRETGISAYVKEMYAHIRQSRFEEQYADLEEI